MELKDFEVGQRVFKSQGIFGVKTGVVTQVNRDRVLVKIDGEPSTFTVKHNPELWEPVRMNSKQENAMSKFKVGDTVVRTGYDFISVHQGNIYVVTGVNSAGDIRVRGGGTTWYADKLFEIVPKHPEPAQVKDWSYAEAQRLAAAADAAIDEYNAYIEKQPKLVFISKIK